MSKNLYDNIRRDLLANADTKKAKDFARFFKTGKGEYGYGDIFWGITVPKTRKVANDFYKRATFTDIKALLKSKVHEQRLCALVMLCKQYEKAHDEDLKKKIVKLYLSEKKNINNWDLVDVTAPRILGDYLFGKYKSVLFDLAKSKNLWDKRIAIISTLGFIVKGDDTTTYKIAEILMEDDHDLIHKAVGWMLREAGKRVSEESLKKFLDKNILHMPRTTLRYAIERFPQKVRKEYLSK